MKKCVVCNTEVEDNVTMHCSVSRFEPVEEIKEEVQVEETNLPEENTINADELLEELIAVIDLESLNIQYPEYIEQIPVDEVKDFAKKHYLENESVIAKVKKYLGV